MGRRKVIITVLISEKGGRELGRLGTGGFERVRERQRLHNKLFTPPLALFYTPLLSINAAWQGPQRALQFTATSYKQPLIIQYKSPLRSSASD